MYNFIIERAYFHLKSPSLSRSQNRFDSFLFRNASYKILLNSLVIPKKFKNNLYHFALLQIRGKN